MHCAVPRQFLTAGSKVAAILDRSPYGENAEELLAEIGLFDNHTAVRQDDRGTKQSEGRFSLWHSSADDAYDTVDWIIQQNWSNGVVYLMGVSADGLEDFATIANPHPAVHAQFAMFAGTSGYEMIFPGGAVREALVDGWLQSTVPTNSSALIAETYSHEVPDQWWDILVRGHSSYCYSLGIVGGELVCVYHCLRRVSPILL